MRNNRNAKGNIENLKESKKKVVRNRKITEKEVDKQIGDIEANKINSEIKLEVEENNNEPIEKNTHQIIDEEVDLLKKDTNEVITDEIKEKTVNEIIESEKQIPNDVEMHLETMKSNSTLKIVCTTIGVLAVIIFIALVLNLK